MISSPRRLTLGRWWALVRRPRHTLLRNLELERIEELHLEGSCLDVGGGRNCGYVERMQINGSLHAVNIDETLGITCKADLNAGIPIVASAFQNVISFNTLEHIRYDIELCREMHRVLAPGGTLYVIVPFLYRVHASPGDYHRHTGTSWEEIFQECGFPSHQIEIEPLIFGPLSTPLSMVEFRYPAFVRGGLRALLLLIPILKAWLRPRTRQDNGANLPMGYFVRARKAEDES